MNNASLDHPAPIIGQSLLPKGRELGEYVASLQEIVAQTLLAHDMRADGALNILLVNECLRAAGWNTQIHCMSAIIKDEAESLSRINNAVYLLLDDGGVVSVEGVVGMEAIKDAVEQQMRNRLREDIEYKKSLRHHPRVELCLLSAPTQWCEDMIPWSKKRHKELLDIFYYHPKSRDVVQGIASALIAGKLDGESVAPARKSIKTRL